MQINEHYIPIIVVVLSVLGGIITWSFTEKAKRSHEEYIRREERYANLIRAIHGFSSELGSQELQQKFIGELELAWLYCPDEVIKKGYAFLETMEVGQKASQENIQKALGELMIEIRVDLLKRKSVKSTDLKAGDFKLIKALGEKGIGDFRLPSIYCK